MASADAIGNEPVPREQEIILPVYVRLRVGSNEDQGFVASLLHLHGLSIRIEFAHSAISKASRCVRFGTPCFLRATHCSRMLRSIQHGKTDSAEITKASLLK